MRNMLEDMRSTRQMVALTFCADTWEGKPWRTSRCSGRLTAAGDRDVETSSPLVIWNKVTPEITPNIPTQRYAASFKPLIYNVNTLQPLHQGVRTVERWGCQFPPSSSCPFGTEFHTSRSSLKYLILDIMARSSLACQPGLGAIHFSRFTS